MQTARFFLCLVGFAGFALTFFVGAFSGGDLINVLRDASIACVIAGLIAQAFLHIMFTALRTPEPEEVTEPEAEAEAAQKPAKPTSQAQKPSVATTANRESAQAKS